MLTFALKNSLITMYKGFITPIEIPRSRVKITHECPILIMGSCFAENIGQRLKVGKFKCEENPFGVLYNPLSIATAIRQMMEGRTYGKDAPELVEHGGMWHSLMHHGSFSATTQEECLRNINGRLAEAHDFLPQTRLMLITFGTAYVYRHREKGIVVGNCHKLPERTFSRERLTTEEIVTEYTALIKEVKVGREGYIAAMDTEALGYAAQAMGAGRVQKTDVIDYSVGYILPVRIGDHVTADTTLCTLYARNEADALKAEAAIRAAITIGDEPVDRPPLWYAVVTADGVERFA